MFKDETFAEDQYRLMKRAGFDQRIGLGEERLFPFKRELIPKPLRAFTKGQIPGRGLEENGKDIHKHGEAGECQEKRRDDGSVQRRNTL